MAEMRGIVAWVARSGKRIGITVVGFGLLVAGIIMLALPGPGIVVIIAGLAVLGSEYAWARRALNEAKRRAGQARDKAGGLLRRRRKDQDPA